MAIDPRNLQTGLSEYRQVVEQHGRQIQPEFADLQAQWTALFAEYEGQAAEELAASWARTARWYEEEYIPTTLALVAFLEERSEHLKPL